jgi:hypothetical protein
MIGSGINLIDLLNAYGLRNKIITYVKNESSNLTPITNALKLVVTLWFERELVRDMFWACFIQSVPINHNC